MLTHSCLARSNADRKVRRPTPMDVHEVRITALHRALGAVERSAIQCYPIQKIRNVKGLYCNGLAQLSRQND